MKPFVRALAFLAVLLVPFAASAQKFEPQVGQAGKDVIWVPTPEEVVDRMKDWSHAGHVTLARGERSRLADHAAEVL